jgi:P-type Cu2+ transporter
MTDAASTSANKPLPDGARRIGSAALPVGPLEVTDDFSALDDPEEQRAFTEGPETSRSGAAESLLVVQGMYCAACADTVEAALRAQPGVLRAEVNAASRRLRLHWDPSQIRLSALAQAVGRRGYRVLPLSQAFSLGQRLAETRKALWRLFVAGFCMMQVMMYAWPAYVSEPGEIPADIAQLLNWGSWIVSVPVLLFASGPFFGGAWRDLKQGRVGMDTPVSIGILVTFFVSTAATLEPTGPWGSEVWFDSLTMFVFFLLGGRYLELKARDRTAGALDALVSRLPETCERELADGRWEQVAVRRLQQHDVVRVAAGQAFPGDGILLDASASVDEALLTGEARPVHRVAGDAVVAGSFNLAGPVRVRLTAVGASTRFAQIVALMERAATEKPRLAVLADRIAAPFLILVLLAAAFSAWYWWDSDPHRAIATAVAVLIVTCPCALSLATPAAMLASAGALARRGVLVRRLQAFEALDGVDVVVFDKTGTLTDEQARLTAVFTRPGVAREQALARAQALASASRHPVSRAIAAAAGERTPMAGTVTEHAGQGLLCLRPDGTEWRLGSARFCGLDALALAAEGVPTPEAPHAHLSDDQGWVATFVIDESLRPDAAATVARLEAIGLQTWLLSGDQAAAAWRIARSVGITQVVAAASPEQKLDHLLALQAQGHRVVMVGDGLNDGPVLARANASMALGHALPLAQSQSDLVLQGGRLADVADALDQSRATMRIVRQNLVWAGVYNAVCVPFALMGWMPPWLAGLGMAASSLFVIANALRLSRRGETATSAQALPVPAPVAG